MHPGCTGSAALQRRVRSGQPPPSLSRREQMNTGMMTVQTIAPAADKKRTRGYTSTPTGVAESHTSWESGGWQWLLQKHWLRVSLGRDWKFPNILASSR